MIRMKNPAGLQSTVLSLPRGKFLGKRLGEGDLANKSPARGGAKRQASERMNNARDSSNRLAQRTIINGKMSRATSAIRPTAEEGSMKMCSRLCRSDNVSIPPGGTR